MDDISSEVRRYLRYLRRYWWLLLAGGLLGVSAWVFVREGPIAPTVSKVSVIILAERWSGLSSGTSPGTLFSEDPDALAVAVARVSATDVLTELVEGTDVTPDDITFALDGRRVLVNIGASLESASTIGDRIASRLTELRLADVLQPIDTATGAARLRLDSLAAEISTATPGPDHAALVTEEAQISTQLGMLEAAADRAPDQLRTEVLKDQALATAASRSDSGSALMAIVFLVTGVALAGVAVIFFSVLDRRVLTRRDCEAVLGANSLVAVLPSEPSDADMHAAATAIAQLRRQSPDLALVGLGGSNVVRAQESLSQATGSPAHDLDSLLEGKVPFACVVVLPVGKVSDRELERTKFVLDRAGVQTVRCILCEARSRLDALD